MTKPMLSRVPDELHARVKSEAAKQGVSMTKIVEDALEMYLNSIFLRALMERDGQKIVFSFNKHEADKLRSFDEEIAERD